MSIYSHSNPPAGFYVYAYIRTKDTENGKIGTPYYIGKGFRRRAVEKHGVNIPKDHTNILILSQNLTESSAFSLEKHYISLYGRIDLGNGILRNKTNGGEGGSGSIRTKEWRNSRCGPGNTMYGKRLCGPANGMYGKNHSAKSRELMRQNHGDRSGPKNGMFGKKHKEESKRYGKDHHYFGKKRKEEDLISLRKGIENSRKECEHCGKIIAKVNYNRWHGNKCKLLK